MNLPISFFMDGSCGFICTVSSAEESSSRDRVGSPQCLQVISKPRIASIRKFVPMTPIDSAHDEEVLLVADGGRAAERLDALLRDSAFTVRPIDPWDDDGTAVHLGVTSLPTALLVRHGAVVARLTSTRRRAIDRFLAAARRPSGDEGAMSHGVCRDRPTAYLRHLGSIGRLPASVVGPTWPIAPRASRTATQTAADSRHLASGDRGRSLPALPLPATSSKSQEPA